MVNVVDCECCGAALSYGEAFRHSVAIDVAKGRIDSKRILGDRLSPRQPKKLCSGCRLHAERSQIHPPVESNNPQWVLPILAVFAGALVLTALLNRHA